MDFIDSKMNTKGHIELVDKMIPPLSNHMFFMLHSEKNRFE